MKKRILSLVLCAAMLLSMCLFLGAGVAEDTTADGSAETTESYIPAVNFTNVAPFVQANAQAANGPARAPLRASTNDGSTTPTDPSRKISDAVVTEKTATKNADGTYTIKLTSYTTGTVTEQQTTKPTDIVLVLDQSGSMDDRMGTVSFEEYEDETGWGTTYHTRNQDYYEYRHNGGSANLWYKLSDGTYRPVSVTREGVDYKKLSGLTNKQYNHYAENNTPGELYVKYGNEYSLVTVTADSRYSTATYTYKDANGKVIAKSSRANTKPDFSGIDGLYAATSYRYTYSYTDANGVMREIGSSTGVDTVFSPTLYKRTVDLSSGEKRLDALKNAATKFAEAVAKKAAGKDGRLGTGDDIDHRIAVVGFASESGYGDNTELLSISGTNSGSVGVAYNNIKEQNLKDVLQSMKTAAGQTMVTSAIDALAASGATRTDLGMDMAKRILSANPVPAGQERNRVVVVFTDGSPTNGNGFQRDIANSAITTADDIKKANATVYSIGIFSGADATSSGEKPSVDYYVDYYGNSNYTAQQMTNACNWFMQNLSSNNGTVRNPSYYLSAADSDSLNSIFKQISDNISTPSIKLGSKAEVRDIVSPYFTAPANADGITVYAEKAGPDGSGGYSWEKDKAYTDSAKMKAGVKGQTVTVSGFDYDANFVSQTARNENDSTSTEGCDFYGRRLVISFTVVPKDGFLGGNNVPTNTSDSGVYDENKTLVENFEYPRVNVPITTPVLTPKDANVYYGGDVPKVEALCTTDTIGKKMDDYVNITYSVNGTVSNTTDSTYQVTMTVSPIYSGEKADGEPATEKTAFVMSKVNVYKPEVTYQDCTTNYGVAPEYSTANFVCAEWKSSSGTSADDVAMTGDEPELTYAYMPVDNSFTKDTYVNVTVSANGTELPEGVVAFVHDDTCGFPGCNFNSENGQFIVHINVFDLTIVKAAADDRKPIDPHQTFVFKVTNKDTGKTMEVVITGPNNQTIKNLPVGNYTITEDTNWSWKYKPVDSDTQELKADGIKNGAATVTFVNENKGTNWLTSLADVINKWLSADDVKQFPGKN